jgi:lactam utilization protein B
MAHGLARKYEINADMGEGFGRWKMVSWHILWSSYVSLTNADFRALMKN